MNSSAQNNGCLNGKVSRVYNLCSNSGTFTLSFLHFLRYTMIKRMQFLEKDRMNRK